MATSDDIASLISEIMNTRGVMASARIYVESMPGRIQAAIDAAMALGATREMLEPLFAEKDSLQTETDALMDAIAANP